MIKASAPGKIVLSGEYAVLDGAPAVCMAINRRARATVISTSLPCHTVVAPGYSKIEGRFTSRGGRVRWQQGQEEYRIVDALWHAIRPSTDSNLAMTLDTKEFHESASGDKIGFGSSAALTVALARALDEYLKSGADVSCLAMAAHRAMQGGKGSGVDVACSFTGGVIDFRMNEPAISTIDWPSGLAYSVLWSGVAASSSDRISRFESSTRKPSRAELGIEADRTAAAWRAGEVAKLLRQYRDYCAALRCFSAEHELGIYDAGHEDVAAAADAARLVYKPCGAGGGDIGIVLGDDVDAVARFAEDSQAFGFRPIDVAIDNVGVALDA